MSYRWLLGFAIAAGVGGVAHGEPSDADKKHAAELAQESQQHYKRGELEISAALLRQAYALYPEPNLLYNLGRSLEGLGDKQGAVEAYENYLATAKEVDDRGAIERRIATLKAELAERAKPVEPTPPPPIEPVKPPPEKIIVIAPAVEQPSALPWLPIGVGAAAIGAGVLFGVTARGAHDDAVAAVSGVDAQKRQDDAHRDATIANVAFIAGGVVLAAGIAWEIYEHRHRDAPTTALRAKIAPANVALEWSW